MAINSSVTLRRLIQELKEWAEAHGMIAKFGYGDILYLYQKEERLYPYFMVNCNNQSSDQWYIKYQLEVFVGFWIWDDKSNQERAESDSNDIVQDLLNTIRISPRWQSFSKLGSEFSGLKIVERTGDKVTGWGGTINLWVKKKSGICDLALLMPEYDFNTQSTIIPGTPFKINGTEVDELVCGETFDLTLIDTDGNVPDHSYDEPLKKLTVAAATPPSIDIEINDDPFLSDVGTDQNIEVIGTDNLPKGGPISGPKWQIGDAQVIVKNTADEIQITANVYAESQGNEFIAENVTSDFQGTNILQETPSGQNKHIESIDEDDNPVGTIEVNLSNALVVRISNGTVSINGAPFASILASGAIDINVIASGGGYPVGVQVGNDFYIGTSDLYFNGNFYDFLYAESSNNIPIKNSNGDNVGTIGMLGVTIGDSTVNIKNSANTTLHSVTVKAEETVSQTIADTTANAKNSAGTVLATGVVVSGVTKDLTVANITVTINGQAQAPSLAGINLSFTPTVIGYIRPSANGTEGTSYLTGDDGWIYANDNDGYTYPAFAVPALLDKSNPFLLQNNNAFGHKQRFTGINGGYYDYTTAQYKLANGTVSDQATTFGTIAANTSYLIDHHTGLGWKWNTQGAATWATQVTNIQGLTHATYTDWQLASRKQIESLLSFKITNLTGILPFNGGGQIKTSTPTLSTETLNHHSLSALVWVSSRADGSADGAYAVRRHYT